MTKTTTVEEQIENSITKVMEDTYQHIVGEDGLTTWDFAELRDNLVKEFSVLEASVREDVEQDKKRLDFLDRCNNTLNKKYGTTYGWKLIINHNITRLMTGDIADIDLNDANAGNDKHKSCRDAIDEVLKQLSRKDSE